MKKILIAAGLLSAAAIAGASLSVAQGYYGEPAPYAGSLDYSPNMIDVTPGTPGPSWTHENLPVLKITAGLAW